MCNMELRKKFGNRLKQLRKFRGLTQEQLAERLDLSVEMVSFMERGIHAPSFETLGRLSEVLQLPVQDLFAFEGSTD